MSTTTDVVFNVMEISLLGQGRRYIAEVMI